MQGTTVVYECPNCGYIAETTGFPSCPGCGCPARETYRPLSEGSAYKGLFTGISTEGPVGPTARGPQGTTLYYLDTFDNELCNLAGRWYIALDPGLQDRVDGTIFAFVSALVEADRQPYNPREAGLVLRRIWSAVADALLAVPSRSGCDHCTFSDGESGCEIDERGPRRTPLDDPGAPGGGEAACPFFAGLVDTENLKLRLRYRLSHKGTP